MFESSRIRWGEIETALEGAVDMRFIKDDDLDKYKEHFGRVQTAVSLYSPLVQRVAIRIS